MFRVLSFGLLFVPVVVHAQIHADFKAYHDLFVAEATARGVTLAKAAPAKMQYFEASGVTWKGIVFNDGSIYFNRDIWQSASEAGREKLVFHELGHWYLDSGHIRHRDGIMNPNTEVETYAASRTAMIDALFMEVYGSGGNSTSLTLTGGSIIICSDGVESETFRMYVMPRDGIERFKAVLDSIHGTHVQMDYINPYAWRYRPKRYTGTVPLVREGERILEVYGKYGKIYMYAADMAKAPRVREFRARWDEDTEMTLVVDYKTATVPVTLNTVILYYVKSPTSAADAKKQINVK